MSCEERLVERVPHIVPHVEVGAGGCERQHKQRATRDIEFEVIFGARERSRWRRDNAWHHGRARSGSTTGQTVTLSASASRGDTLTVQGAAEARYRYVDPGVTLISTPFSFTYSAACVGARSAINDCGARQLLFTWPGHQDRRLRLPLPWPTGRPEFPRAVRVMAKPLMLSEQRLAG